jgi:hypothetical protein
MIAFVAVVVEMDHHQWRWERVLFLAPDCLLVDSWKKEEEEEREKEEKEEGEKSPIRDRLVRYIANMVTGRVFYIFA